MTEPTNVPETTDLAQPAEAELAPVEEFECPEPMTIPAPPASFDEDLHSRPDMPLRQQFLRVQQQRALSMLMSGSSVADIASTLNVGRSTIYYWMRHDPPFVAAVQAWRDRARQEVADELLRMTNTALRIVQNAAVEGNLSAALAILKSQGVLNAPDKPARRRGSGAEALTPNVVMEHRRTTVAVNMPTKALEKPEVRQLPDAEQEK